MISSRAWRVGAALWAVLAATAGRAADIHLSVELPRLKHRPYLAVWLEREDRQRVAELALWHEGGRQGKKESKKGKGDKYLPDLRQWWRTGGSVLPAPIDGVSGPTRPAGSHQLQFSEGRSPLGTLAPGRYRLVVEASREDGRDETLGFPMDWPPTARKEQWQEGRHELGEVVLELRP